MASLRADVSARVVVMHNRNEMPTVGLLKTPSMGIHPHGLLTIPLAELPRELTLQFVAWVNRLHIIVG